MRRHEPAVKPVCISFRSAPIQLFRCHATRGVLRHPRPPFQRSRQTPAPRTHYPYRTSAFSWSLSNLVPNSRSNRSPISCHVLPAVFISLITVSAFIKERSSASSCRKAFRNSWPRTRPRASLLTGSLKGATAPFRRRGLSQYGLLQRGQRAGLLGRRGHQVLPQRWQNWLCNISGFSFSRYEYSQTSRFIV